MLRTVRNSLAITLIAMGAIQFGGCHSAAPPTAAHADIEQSQLASAASAAFERGRIEEAEILYRRQLTRALASDDPTAISDAEYNVALCVLRRNRPAEAAPLLVDAEMESRRAGANPADIILLQAISARMLGQYADAITLAREVFSTPGTTPTQRTHAHVIAGLSQFSLGEQSEATNELTKAQKEAPEISDTAVLAGVAELSGRIAETSGHPNTAARNYDNQAQLLYRAGLYHDMSDALQHAGGAYRASGMATAAADRFYRSARSIAAQGDPASASFAARQAAESAAASGDAESIARVAALVKELAPATQAVSPAASAP